MKYLKYIFILLSAACIAFIWYHSSMNGDESAAESQNVLEIIKNFMTFIGISGNVNEFIIRKLAHFLEFSGLGFLLTCDVYLWSNNPKRYIYLPLFIGLFTACVDETIQIFSYGRSSKVTDVWVDFSGAAAATVITCILINIILKKLQKKQRRSKAI